MHMLKRLHVSTRLPLILACGALLALPWLQRQC